ncbi:hypothetical protein RA269_27675, partial [Pseudomonas syringae pv. tagetis]|uniref:hypothetical protein n=1 Tax=Pseudomonas syringae group genomosp. 7 TaxID=251699 RepID=UPI00376FD8BE
CWPEASRRGVWPMAAAALYPGMEGKGGLPELLGGFGGVLVVFFVVGVLVCGVWVGWVFGWWCVWGLSWVLVWWGRWLGFWCGCCWGVGFGFWGVVGVVVFCIGWLGLLCFCVCPLTISAAPLRSYPAQLCKSSRV